MCIKNVHNNSNANITLFENIFIDLPWIIDFFAERNMLSKNKIKYIRSLELKKNRKEEMFLAITESKKIVSGEGDDAQVSFEKHKIFLYKEDFEKFMDGLHQAIQYIESDGNEDLPLPEESNTEEIKIDIDF